MALTPPSPVASPPPPGTATTLVRAPVTLPTNTTPYFNRDLSWLDFNHRVLHEAQDPRTPLLERVKFLAIYSSNSDEFFMKRVGLLARKLAQKTTERSHDGLTIEQHFEAVIAKLRGLTREVVDLWTQTLRPALENEGIFIRDYVELSPEQ